jgi:hypothetical protein
METEVMKIAISQGFGYVLFTFLLIYVLKTTQDRENRLNITIEKNQEIIGNLTQNNGKIEKIEKDVQDIKDKIK